jgi:MFS family permease
LSGRNIRTIALSELFNDVTVSSQGPLIPLFYLALGATPLQYGLLDGLGTLLATLAASPGGEVADRFGRTLPVRIGFGLMFLARAAFYLVNSVVGVFAVRAIGLFGRYFRYPARDALLSESVSPGERSMAFAKYQFADNLGSVLGPGFSIFLLGLLGQTVGGLRLTFLFTAVPAGIAALVVSLYVIETLKDRSRIQRQPYLTKLRSILADRKIREFIVVTGLFNLVLVSANFMVVYASRGPLEASPIAATELYFVWALTALAAAIPAGRMVKRAGKTAGILVSLGTYAACAALTVFSGRSFLLLALAFGVLGINEAIFPTAWRSFMADSVDASRRGMAMSTYSTLSGVTNDAAAPAIAGFLFTLFSPEAPFILGLAVALSLMVVFPLAMKSRERGRNEKSNE